MTAPSVRRREARKHAHALSQHIASVCVGVATVEMGHTRRWLAAKAGIDESHLSHIVAGRRVLSLEAAISLCDVVMLDISDVVRGLP